MTTLVQDPTAGVQVVIQQQYQNVQTVTYFDAEGKPLSLLAAAIEHHIRNSAHLEKKLFIEQKWVWPKECCACEAENLYTAHVGNRQVHSPPIFFVKEKSGCCVRVCCAPHNSMFLTVSGTEPPMSNKNQFEDWAKQPGNVWYTMERPGCCTARPCLGCCACNEICLDTMTVYPGYVGDGYGEVGELKGVPPAHFRMQQAPAMQAMFEPTINIFKADADGTFAQPPELVVKGPCIFGGWSELCCSSHFVTRNKAGTVVGEVTKLRPKSLCDCCDECVSDIDRYAVTYTDEKTGQLLGSSPEERAQMALSAFLVDYMFFELDNGMCHKSSQGDYECTCFQCYCCGCVRSCNCWVTTNSSGSA